MSRDNSHKATIVPVADGDGCWVTLQRVTPPMTIYGSWFMRGPLHVVRDAVHDIIYPITADGPRLVWDADLRRVVRRGNYSGSN